MNKRHQISIKIDTAKEMMDSFFISTGIPCSMYSCSGEMLYECGGFRDGCSICRELSEASGMDFFAKKYIWKQ